MSPLAFQPGEGVVIDRVTIENYRSIERMELKFRNKLTLLIGENGAGKTTVLDALSVLLGGTMPRWGSVNDGDRRRVAGVARTETILAASRGGRDWESRISSLGQTAFRGPDTEGVVRAYFGADRWNEGDYKRLVEWFEERDIAEVRQQREAQDLDFRDPQLAEVRRRVARMIPGASNPRIDPTGRFVVDQQMGADSEKFEVSQLAGGLRTMLVLVADLARMIVSMKNGSTDPLKAVVLIDEVDLHLHPRWQLDVMNNLVTAFPEAQFVATTHSEEIIASVPSECVVSLQNRNGQVVATAIPPVQGATFERVLEDAMGVPGHRPPEFQRHLDEYWKLVDAGAGESPEGLALRRQLDDWFRGQEPELVKADLAIRRKRARAGTGT
jgi:predicted ATP-binding protein involved in virulence